MEIEVEPDNRTFLQKYWTYVVPGAIMLLLQSMGGKTPQQPQRRQGAAT